MDRIKDVAIEFEANKPAIEQMYAHHGVCNIGLDPKFLAHVSADEPSFDKLIETHFRA